MPAVAPTLNLLCNIWKQLDTHLGPPIVAPTHPNVPCNLQYARKIHGANLGYIFVLLPKGTDVEDTPLSSAATFDVMEIPAGSKRWYCVYVVDDMAKGFPTETRVAEVTHAHIAVATVDELLWMWPVPYP